MPTEILKDETVVDLDTVIYRDGREVRVRVQVCRPIRASEAVMDEALTALDRALAAHEKAT